MSFSLFSKFFPLAEIISGGPQWMVEANSVKVRVPIVSDFESQHISLEEFRAFERNPTGTKTVFSAGSTNNLVLDVFYGRRYLLRLTGVLTALVWTLSASCLIYGSVVQVTDAVKNSNMSLSVFWDGETVTWLGISTSVFVVLTLFFNVFRGSILSKAEEELELCKFEAK